MKEHISSERLALLLLCAAILPGTASAGIQKDAFCSPLKTFVASVGKGETRTLEFHTSWGRGFKSSPKNVFFEKRCLDGGFAPAKSTCDYLMQHGQVEFAGNNALRAIECLSAGTHFADMLQLARVGVSFSYGTEERGSNVTIQYGEDNKLGGMVMTISADGY